jgi:hypothetical protein
MPNSRLSGVFKTTILRITRVPAPKDPTYEVAVIVNGVSYVVRVGIMERLQGAYISEGGFDEAFTYARGAVRAIGTWANRVHKGEAIQFPVQLVI